MNLSIFKYKLPVTDKQVLKLPDNARILSVQGQHKEVCLWALVDPDAPLVNHSIEMITTGESIVPKDRLYHGTVQLLDGNFVCHVFEVLERE